MVGTVFHLHLGPVFGLINHLHDEHKTWLLDERRPSHVVSSSCRNGRLLIEPKKSDGPRNAFPDVEAPQKRLGDHASNLHLNYRKTTPLASEPAPLVLLNERRV